MVPSATNQSQSVITDVIIIQERSHHDDAVGNSTGLVLPKDLLARLRVEKGDTLFAVETANGLEITPYDPEFAQQMAVAEEIMHDDRDVLKKLGR